MRAHRMYLSRVVHTTVACRVSVPSLSGNGALAVESRFTCHPRSLRSQRNATHARTQPRYWRTRERARARMLRVYIIQVYLCRHLRRVVGFSRAAQPHRFGVWSVHTTRAERTVQTTAISCKYTRYLSLSRSVAQCISRFSASMSP